MVRLHGCSHGENSTWPLETVKPSHGGLLELPKTRLLSLASTCETRPDSPAIHMILLHDTTCPEQRRIEGGRRQCRLHMHVPVPVPGHVPEPLSVPSQSWPQKALCCTEMPKVSYIMQKGDFEVGSEAFRTHSQRLGMPVGMRDRASGCMGFLREGGRPVATMLWCLHNRLRHSQPSISVPSQLLTATTFGKNSQPSLTLNQCRPPTPPAARPAPNHIGPKH